MGKRREKPRATTIRYCIECGRMLIIAASAVPGIGPACLHNHVNPRPKKPRYRPPHPHNTTARRLLREDFVRRYSRDVGHLVDFCQSWGTGADKIRTFVDTIVRTELNYKPGPNWKPIWFTISRDYRRLFEYKPPKR
jgi:hypothetical protein